MARSESFICYLDQLLKVNGFFGALKVAYLKIKDKFTLFSFPIGCKGLKTVLL